MNSSLTGQSVPSSVGVSDNIHQTISSMPIVSALTESHKVEQVQLRTSKTQHVKKLRRKNVNLPSQPLVMPRSAEMFNDIEEHFSGLEFGSGPLSCKTSANDNQSPLVDLRYGKFALLFQCNPIKTLADLSHYVPF